MRNKPTKADLDKLGYELTCAPKDSQKERILRQFCDEWGIQRTKHRPHKSIRSLRKFIGKWLPALPFNGEMP